MYHARLMNIFILSRVKKDRLSIYFINSLNKEKKWGHLFVLREGNSFLGMFYGFKKIRRNEFIAITFLFVNCLKKYLELLIRLITLSLDSKQVVYFYISTL
ncbi:DUF226 domain-containing protein [Borreliella turdi]|uniref:DUF226 domain-containing protein n=1 Tax=Borreliella turdi TaxID=57863 RepID=UPI001244632E|nr:DUF226 domain-containing protein [Borreliella turdi]